MKIDLKNCCGCMACMNICPKQAISEIETKEGFVIPSIDEEKCIKCGLCEAVCDFSKNRDSKSSVISAYSLIHKNRSVVRQSSSGGAFTAISDVVLSKKGYIAGVLFDDEFNLNYVLTSLLTDRDMMRGSKYVQSHIGLIFKEIKKKLDNEELVLFVGTPCQCAGLNSFLRKEYSNLVIVDFLCHGVPSNRMFKDHISYLNSHYGSSVKDYSFRSKKYGWNSFTCIATLSNGEEKADWINQCFLNWFSYNLSLRPSCYNCPYRNANRPSDITIADFWDIEKITHEKNKTGVSFVLSNSAKGEQMMELVKDKCNMARYSEQDVEFRIQKKPIEKRKNTDLFWQIYSSSGYEELVKKFFDNSVKSRSRYMIKKIVKRLRIK